MKKQYFILLALFFSFYHVYAVINNKTILVPPQGNIINLYYDIHCGCQDEGLGKIQAHAIFQKMVEDDNGIILSEGCMDIKLDEFSKDVLDYLKSNEDFELDSTEKNNSPLSELQKINNQNIYCSDPRDGIKNLFNIIGIILVIFKKVKNIEMQIQFLSKLHDMINENSIIYYLDQLLAKVDEIKSYLKENDREHYQEEYFVATKTIINTFKEVLLEDATMDDLNIKISLSKFLSDQIDRSLITKRIEEQLEFLLCLLQEESISRLLDLDIISKIIKHSNKNFHIVVGAEHALNIHQILIESNCNEKFSIINIEEYSSWMYKDIIEKSGKSFLVNIKPLTIEQLMQN